MIMKHLPSVMLLALSGASFAAGAPVAVQFSADAPVDPLGANANFQELADRIDDASTSQSAALVSAAASFNQDLSDLNGLLDAYFNGLTDEFYILEDVVESRSAETSEDIARLSAQISVNEERDSSDYLELSGRIDTAAPLAQYVQNENLAQRVFIDVANQDSEACDQREDNFTFYTDDKILMQDISFASTSGSVTCDGFRYFWDYENGLSTSLYVLRGASDLSFTLSQGWQVLKGTMRYGETWGNYNQRTLVVNGSDTIPAGSEYHRTTLLGREDVTVAAGTFSACLVIDELVWFGTAQQARLYYFCDGPGMVRYINITNGQDWQLQSYIEN